MNSVEKPSMQLVLLRFILDCIAVRSHTSVNYVKNTSGSGETSDTTQHQFIQMIGQCNVET